MVAGSVNVTRRADHWSNQRPAAQPARTPATPPFTERPPSTAPRLWTTNPAAAAAARNATGSTDTVPAHFEYSTTCGVHNLWTKLLITCGGARWTTDE